MRVGLLRKPFPEVIKDRKEVKEMVRIPRWYLILVFVLLTLFRAQLFIPVGYGTFVVQTTGVAMVLEDRTTASLGWVQTP